MSCISVADEIDGPFIYMLMTACVPWPAWTRSCAFIPMKTTMTETAAAGSRPLYISVCVYLSRWARQIATVGVGRRSRDRVAQTVTI